MRTLFAFALPLLLLQPFLGCRKPAPLPGPTVLARKGVVKYLDPADLNWKNVRKGQELPVGAELITKRGGRVVLGFPDGSKIELRSRASFTVEKHVEGLAEMLIKKGRLSAWIPKLEKRRFLVRTPSPSPRSAGLGSA